MNPEIPEGMYCYTILGIDIPIVGGPPEMHTKVCPHWKFLEKGRGRCEYLGIEDEVPYDLSLLWDQVKACGINEEETEQD
jgi:hypothetical protein